MTADPFAALHDQLSLLGVSLAQWEDRDQRGRSLSGLAVSVAGNVGHIVGHSLTSRGTAAVPPLASPPLVVRAITPDRLRQAIEDAEAERGLQ